MTKSGHHRAQPRRDQTRRLHHRHGTGGRQARRASALHGHARSRGQEQKRFYARLHQECAGKCCEGEEIVEKWNASAWTVDPAEYGKQLEQLLQLVTTYTLRALQSCCKVNNKKHRFALDIPCRICPGEALFIVVSMQQPLVYTGLEEAMSWRSCSITWHSFSPWHNLSKLSSAHGLPKEL